MSLSHPKAVCICWIVLAFSSLGCGATIRIRPYELSADPTLAEGIVYYLPTTRLRISVTYSVVEVHVWNVVMANAHGSNPLKLDDYGRPIVVDSRGNSIARMKDDSIAIPPAEQFVLERKIPPTRKLYVRDRVTVTPVSVPDPLLAFRVDSDAMRSFWVTTKDAKLTLTPDGILKTANSTFDDRTQQVVGGVVKTGIAVAKMVAGVAGVEKKEEVVLGTVTIDRYVGFDEFTEVNPPPKARVVYAVAPQTREFAAYFDTAASFDAADKASVKVQVDSKVDLIARSAVTAESLTKLPGWSCVERDAHLDGLLFRIPAPVLETVLVDDTPVTQVHQSVAQAGGFSWVPVQSHMFSSTTIGLTLSEINGGATEYGYGATSSAEAIANALQSSAEAAQPSVKTLEDAAIQGEIDRLKKEKELLDAEAALKKAKSEAAASGK